MKEDACHTVNAQNVISKTGTHKGPWVEVIKSSLSILKLKSRLMRFLPSPECFLAHFFIIIIKLCERMIDPTGKPEVNKTLNRDCLYRKGRPEKECLEKLRVLFV